MTMENLHSIARQMIESALQAVSPERLIKNHLKLKNGRLKIGELEFDLSTYQNVFVLGAGKASAAMARAVEELLQDYIAEGCVVVKYGHSLPTRRIKILEAGHPIPDDNTLKATNTMLELADQAGENDLVLVLISGGGSALMEMLPPEIELRDLQEMNHQLLACGATISEINTVRKHVSLVKGGQLARRIFPAQVVTLVLSDVIGDDLQNIASGPTAPDLTTFADAWKILEKYFLTQKIPLAIKEYLQKGLTKKVAETPKSNDPVFKKVTNLILGNNRLALKQAQKVALKAGFSCAVLTDQLQGEVREVAGFLAAIFRSALKHGDPLPSPGCLLVGGEPTVTLQGKGLGGRNQEMALAVFKEMRTIKKPFYFCSVGSDGTDGPTDAAGAYIDHQTEQKVQSLNLDVEHFLQNNDSYHFFKQIDQLIKTGPTGTNVMDLLIFLF